jgi:sterol desaturase/sphingolipid hydroxylase (fatty acid hydroxylase superfamily)
VGEIVVPYLFAALMALEYGYNLARGGRYQSPRDSATSLMVAIPHFAMLSVLPVAWVVLYRLVEHAMPWHLPAAWWIWPLGIVVMDLASYWMHRYHHALNITWGIHSVHHSSDEYTMTTGARSSVAEPLVNVISGAYLILVVPALLGLPVVAAGVGWLVKDIWGFAVHTRNVDKLGPLEWILATPSHHRVHHAINPIYDHKNYGFVMIIWDKLFGTFQPELADEPPIFGTHRPPLSFHPIAVAFHELRLVWRDAAATRRWRDKLRIWFMPAGWRPADVPEHAVHFVRYDSPPPRGLYVVGGLQLVYLVTASFHLSSTIGDCTVGENLAYLGFLIVATAVSGDYFERVRRYSAIETARALGVAAMVALTGTWFGRPLDEVSTALVALAGANLVAAWALRLPRREVLIRGSR